MSLSVKQVGKFDCLSSPTICNKLYVYQPCLAVFKGKGTGDYEIHHGKGNFAKFTSLKLCQKELELHLKSWDLLVSVILLEVFIVSTPLPRQVYLE